MRILNPIYIRVGMCTYILLLGIFLFLYTINVSISFFLVFDTEPHVLIRYNLTSRATWGLQLRDVGLYLDRRCRTCVVL
jgi:hypothetical protein